VELDKPIVGGLATYLAGEAAADHTSGSWKPDFRATAGLKLTF